MKPTYKIISNLFEESNYIERDDNGSKCIIPPDPANSDYQQYLKWLGEGNTPLPPDPIPEPEPLTPQQKLEAAGLTVEELKELLGL
jgi:hypothetical protein